MNKILILLLSLVFLTSAQAQNNYKDGLVELGRAYKSFMFGMDPNKQTIKELQSQNDSDSLTKATKFILECLVTKSKILKPEFLKLPDDQTLKSIYIIGEISENMRKEGGPDNYFLADSLCQSPPTREIQMHSFFRKAFTAYGNKNKPFNLSKYNFNLNSLGLKTDTEKGIFVLNCINACGTQIWGYMNIPRPPNTNKAMSIINKFPEINGQPYFTYTDLYFNDFQFIYDDSLQSFKSIYIHKYYELLLNHLVCLNKENKSQESINTLLLSSILRNENLYKFTSFKTTLEGIFKKQ